MSKDFIEPWQKMMTEWQKTQATMTEQMMENMQQWNRSVSQTDNSYYSNNPLLDIYQSFVQKALSNNPQYNLHNLKSSHDWNDVLSTFPGSDKLITQMNELITGGQEVFARFKKDFAENLPDDETRDYFLNTLDDISNPYSWLQFSSTDFDEGVKRFSEGPLFSGISDVDNRIAKAMDAWLELGEKNNDYYEVLLKNWIKAYERFLEHLKTLESEDTENLSPRKLVELWSSIANEEMMLMHRSEEFLQAQKQLIKASAEYRLYEQEIAEVICEALHVPTRKEVDDLHKTVTELRRELRTLKQQVNAGTSVSKDATAKTTRKAATAKKPTKKKAATTKTTTAKKNSAEKAD